MRGLVTCTVLVLCLCGAVVAAEPDILVADFEGKALVNTFFQGDGTQGTLASPQFKIERKYVNFLLGGGWRPGKVCINLLVDGKVVHTATGPNRQPDGTCPLQESVTQNDEVKGTPVVVDEPYNETYRPQFHYTTRQGWINDPIGLVFYKGEYHLFNDHNPASCRFPGGKTSGEQSHWSHAVSPDLIHWQQMPIAVFPDQHGACWSGSGVVDWNNTAGLQAGEDKTLVLLYTSAGKTFTQSLVYSTDRGRTWTKYEKNPVIGHIAAANRDPKVIWHEPTKKWIMALFLDKQDYTLLSSTNLQEWTRICDIPPMGCGECPDFFELPIDGDENNKTWVFWGGNGNYALGSFDGKTFKKQGGPHPSKYGANDYAAQTFSDVPADDGRRIQISWMARGNYPNMPFNQQMSFPRVLTLRTTEEGVRLFMEPVKEIELLHEKEHALSNVTLKPGENPLKDVSGDLFHIVGEFEPGKAKAFGFDVRGNKIQYSVVEKTITSLGKKAPLTVKNGKVKLELLVDRTSIELFGNAGQIQMATCFLPDLANRNIGVFADGGEARIVSLKVYKLKSAWTE